MRRLSFFHVLLLLVALPSVWSDDGSNVISNVADGSVGVAKAIVRSVEVAVTIVLGSRKRKRIDKDLPKAKGKSNVDDTDSSDER